MGWHYLALLGTAMKKVGVRLGPKQLSTRAVQSGPGLLKDVS